jgi:hypothetical protein
MPDDKAVTNAELRAALDVAVEAIAARQDRAVEAIASEISSFRTEVNERFAAVDRNFTDLHRRLDRTNEMLTLLQGSSTTLNQWADRLDVDLSQRHRAQDHAIEELRRRIEALEKKAS